MASPPIEHVEQSGRQYVPPKTGHFEYPLIDNDPHVKRVLAYARTSDWIAGVCIGISGPLFIYGLERLKPTYESPRSIARVARFCFALGVTGGFLHVCQKSSLRFYGHHENAREMEMDMREMVAKVKAGEPLYGVSDLPLHMQGVAARQSRYSAIAMGLVPMLNFVNHSEHGVDTAKYYRQAERELQAEREGGGVTQAVLNAWKTHKE
ncbi:hypothetical protein K402DRAFT_463105 [Aulographum hederae CBS 113979]|uniref:NADH-ubiquinone oxidoreductase 21 kDa subunit n=1 Tax=Aulographum hederae CBS 113979 TaxID=1176131 RepID=A0A6G1H1Y4_9PEZI|nr:hypothetical protein K402DRAFT_463105 [Aulographum hederae CBS 113979]